MKSNIAKKLLSAALVALFSASLLPSSALAAAKGDDGSAEMNEAYAAGTSLMPIGPSFNADTLLEWTAASDPDAAYSRSVIPLAERSTGFTVNDTANPEAKLMVCSLANAKHDSTSAQGSDSFTSYAFNYWQYATSFVYWSSSEEGLIVCPTGEFTDAAHTNGVPVMATIGFPWNTGSNSNVTKFVENWQKAADKLIEVMNYYGFDGYFFNEESACSQSEAQTLDRMIRYLHKQSPDMLIGWYDSATTSGSINYQDAVNSSNSGWVKNTSDGNGVDEFFMNYNWNSSKVNTTISTMKSIGRSQYDAFAGIDVQQNCMNTSYNKNAFFQNGKAQLSLALYCPNSTMGLADSGADFHKYEQQFYTNDAGDPRQTSASSNSWVGMSTYFADHTTIRSTPFVTNFNSGHGKKYYIDGVLSRDSAWSYQSNQDVMPTWTWIIDSGGSKLNGSYDFDDAYNGGTSICFSGALTGGKANDIMLYSTDLAINSSTKLSLTTKNDPGCAKLVAYYGDSSTSSYADCNTAEYPLNDSQKGWTTSTVSLSELAGQTLYALGLKVESNTAVSHYKLNLGQLTITDSDAAEASASNAKVEDILFRDAYTAEARISWTGDKNATSYEVYAVTKNGGKRLLMETPNTSYYISSLTKEESDGDLSLEIVPINQNGVRGSSTSVAVDWPYTDGDTERSTVSEEVKNVCLDAEVIGYSAQNDSEPASKAIDGTSENGSKWCATNAQNGWMSIKLKQPATIRRWRVEHAEYGGEANNMNTVAFELQYKSGSNWHTAKSITNNHSAVTDVILDQPVTAQEWKLNISNSGSSAWQGIRIYEWQMFESDQLPRTDTVLMKFAKAVNNPGAADTFTLTNVPDDTTVTLYRKAGDTYEQIASQKSSNHEVHFDDLDFGTASGRVYYTTTADGYSESFKLSTPFDAEEGVAHRINIGKTEHGTVTASAEAASQGETIRLTAEPDDGYALTSYTVNSETISGDHFTMPDSDVTVSAVFEKINVEPAVNLAANATIVGYNKVKLYKDMEKSGPQKLFDGQISNPESDKWSVYGPNSYAAFDIGKKANITSLKVFHAGYVEEDATLNTASYDLYVLRDSIVTDDQFVSYSRSEQRNICGDGSCWIRILKHTGNTDNVSSDSIKLDHPRRIFKFNARTPSGVKSKRYVNIYELELYE